MIARLVFTAALAQATDDVTVVPGPPPVVLLGRRWVVLHAREGDRLDTRLVDPAAAYPERRFTIRNAPYGMDVERDGTLTFLPEKSDVGDWRVQVRVEGEVPRWTGFELHVWPREQTLLGPPRDAQLVESRGAPPPGPGRRAAQGCFLGLGVEVGAGIAPGSSWQHIGDPGVRTTGSPHGSIACTLGSPMAVWIVGLDSAPYVSFPLEEGDGRHALALWTGAQLGTRTWKVGPIVTAGALLGGAGLRAHWHGLGKPGRAPMGLELRGTWLAPSTATASVGWLWAL